MEKIILFLIFALVPFYSLVAESTLDLNKTQIEYQIKDYSYLTGKTGLNDDLMKMHFKLYAGYVNTTSTLLKKLKTIPPLSYEFGALKRRLGWEFDGMRLHEYYFENLGQISEIDTASPLYVEITKQYGSFEAWKRDFVATGAIRGIGWAILYFDPTTKGLINVWINEHNVGGLAGGKILLVMDVFEHAYITQFGLNRGEYMQTFLNHINWPVVYKRYEER